MNLVTRRQFVAAAGSVALLGNVAKLMAAGSTRPPPVATATVESNAVFRPDLSRALPADALDRKDNRDHWQLIDYETEDGLRGTMATAHGEDRCPTLTLPLEMTGPAKIFLGINYTRTPQGDAPRGTQIEVKLSRDKVFRSVLPESPGKGDHSNKFPTTKGLWGSIQEAFWKIDDLSGQSLVFRQPQTESGTRTGEPYSNISYVKIVPLTREEAERWQNGKRRRATRRGAVYDGGISGNTAGSTIAHPTNKQPFVEKFAPYIDADIGVVILDAIRGAFCQFQTKIGDVGAPDNVWRKEWVDPLATYTDLAHEHGIRIFVGLRMIGAGYPTNRSPLGRARYYWEHRQWSKLDRNGLPTTGLSLAFPGVREYWLSVLREALDYGIDGIQLHLNRCYPFVLYEEPVVSDFRRRYGVDPRTLPDMDRRWIEHSAGYVTQFVREVRHLVNERAGCQLGVTVPSLRGDPERYRRSYCDVETWLRERLVDYVMPSWSIDDEMLRRWRTIGGDEVHLWPDLMPRTQPADAYAKLAKTYYAAGADGFALWDGAPRTGRLSEWAAISELGHRDTLDDLLHDGRAYYRSVPLKTLGGLSVKDSFNDG